MESRDDDQPSPRRPPQLSSLVVRLSGSDGSGGRENMSPNVRRDPPPRYSRSDRQSDDLGYRTRARSVSPARRRNSKVRSSSDFDHPPHGRDFMSHRETGRCRARSPAHERGRAGGRPYTRGSDGHGLLVEATRGNNPNVRPREGDWYCLDPSCNYLNFARRDNCNNCNRPRLGDGYAGPRPLYPSPRRFSGPPMDRSAPRPLNGHRSPPRRWSRDRPAPRDFVPGAPPPPRHDYRLRRDRLNYLEDKHRGRDRFEPPVPPEWGHRDRMREVNFSERKGYETQPLQLPPPPPLPAGHDWWGRVARERSRSPIDKGYQRDLYMDRGRDDQRIDARDRIGRTYR